LHVILDRLHATDAPSHRNRFGNSGTGISPSRSMNHALEGFNVISAELKVGFIQDGRLRGDAPEEKKPARPKKGK